ncbi:serine hydrolase domain-containing protein [Actinophytocola gossypii]|uniref:Beta-lactamase family protein n=1 Tax=Actinophytocola gossypii TaxID=2812003 RepID=A0ABT2JJ87_9PSEU|nr:serine hydrolase domain-containing protein [Actinophytocola gossypii]MCT2587851.1 beta-lactamase family protein [Actinophytocola gossypii]
MTEHHRPSRRTVLAALGAAPLAGGVLGASDAAATTGRIPDELRPGGEFDRYLAELAAEDRFAGTVLLTHRDRPVLARSHGFADRARRIPNGPETRFILGSITKVFTALAIAQLAERGEVGFGERVGAYLDGFAPEVADHVTVHQLLTHTSGLGDFHSQEYLEQSRHWDSVEEFWDNTLEFVRRCELQAPPGNASIYSNAGYFILGAIVAKVARRSYYDHVREHVFERAGMTSSDFYTKPRWRADRGFAHPYHRDESGALVDGLELAPFVGAPPGGSFADAADLARFAKLMGGNRLLGVEFRHLAGSPKVPLSPDNTRFHSYLTAVERLNGEWMVGHSGGATYGVSCNLDWFPESDWVAVILGNYGDRSTKPIAEKAHELISRHARG